VAYESLAPDEGRAIHAAAGAALERLYAGRLHEVYDRLGHHYSGSGNVAAAVRYLTLFAEQAAHRYARTEALAALQQALDQVERLRPGPEQDELLGVLIRRQRGALHLLQDLRRPTLDLLLRQRPRVETLDDPAVRSLYYLWLGRLATPLAEFAIAADAAERAIEHADEAGDKIVAAAARSVLSHAYFWRGFAREGLEAARQAVAVLEGTGELVWLGYAWRGISMNIQQHGSDLDAAMAAARRVGEIGETLDDDFFRFTAVWVPAVLLLPTADAATATTAMRRVLDEAPTAYEVAQAEMFMGLMYLDTDRPREALTWLEPLVTSPGRLRQRHVVGLCTAYLAEALLDAGHVERAGIAADDAARVARETDYAYALGYALRVRARLAAARGAPAEGEASADEADRIYERIGSPIERGRVAAARAELARARGEHDVAARLFDEAIDTLRAAGAPRYADRVSALRVSSRRR
jgi:tetratricopeptide (TPR) repeat protein